MPIRRNVGDQNDRYEEPSVSLPLIAMALFAPLTLYACVFVEMLALNNTLDDIGSFDTWILISLCIVGRAHLVLA